MPVPNDSPYTPNLAQQRKRAKDLHHAHREGSSEAAVRIAHNLPRARTLSPENVLASPFSLSEAQFVVAREAGFSSWPNLKHQIEGATHGGRDRNEPLLNAALDGNDDAVVAALDRDPDAPRQSIHVAATLADVGAAIELLDANPEAADQPGGKRAWKPLLYLCSSRYRRGQPGEARANIARRLIALGAATTGREAGFTATHGAMMSQDNDLFAIEAAAGRAASPLLVQLLLEAGADLKQTTVVLLQAVRGGNLEVLKLLLAALPSEVGWQANWAIQESVATGRKDMTRVLADRVELPAEGAIHDAIRVGRDQETIEILLGSKGQSGRGGRRLSKAYRFAIRYGNGMAAGLLARRGADTTAVTDVDRMLGACVTGDRVAFRTLLDQYGSLRPYLCDVDHQMLAWAIRTGHDPAVPLLIEAGLDPDIPDTDGETPLHLAITSGDVETVDLLIRSGADANEGNFDSETPLEIALRLGDREIREMLTRRLLEAGANPARMSRFHPGLWEASATIEAKLRQGGAIEREDPDLLFERAADAVAFGDLEALREMLDEEPWLVNTRSPRLHRATLLHYCGANGVEAARQRTPPNAPAIMQLLLDRGAKVDATCNLYRGGATTLGLLLSSCHPVRAGQRTALCETLLKAGAKFGGAAGATELSRAAALGRLDLVRRYLDDPGGAESRFRKEQIQSAFLWACDFGRTSVVELLLDRGADIAFQNQDGQTGLHLAVVSGHLETAKALLRRQPPLEVENVWGGTVLNHALWAAVNHDPNIDYTPIVEALIEAGAKREPGLLAWWHQQKPLLPSSKPRIEAMLHS